MVSIVLGSQWGDEGGPCLDLKPEVEENAALIRDIQGRERSQTCCRSRRRFAAVQLVATVRAPRDSSLIWPCAAQLVETLRVMIHVPD